MIRIYNFPSKSAVKRLEKIAGRSFDVKKKEIASVARIIEDVRKNKDAALIEYGMRYDCPDLTIRDMKVKPGEIEDARKKVDDEFLSALERAVRQIELFHRGQKRGSFFLADSPGKMLGQMVNPVDVSGMYVPGGRAGKTPLVSTVLMCAIPAVIAGVKKIVMVSPPRSDGSLAPHLLVAADRAGVDEIYKIGSAWAIAALAYGTETVPRADVIVGPGNIYVTIAKSLVSNRVGIDMVAGPSEILVIADRNADASWVAADLLSQAEHDPMASAICVTESKGLASRIKEEIEIQVRDLERREVAEESLAGYGAVFLVRDMAEAIRLANRIAPEHLELQVERPFDILGEIRNAGAVFLGGYTPEAVGDYVAGPNHVLPTSGTARFSSALSVDHFMKKTSLIYYSKEAFLNEADDIAKLAATEGLDAHERSVRIRK